MTVYTLCRVYIVFLIHHIIHEIHFIVEGYHNDEASQKDRGCFLSVEASHQTTD